MTHRITISLPAHFHVGSRSRKVLHSTPQPASSDGGKRGIPRLSKLMALAIRFDHLIRTGAVADQADLARLGHVTRARLTQIMNLLLLAPDIQEEILFHNPAPGIDPLPERKIRALTAIPDWRKQRRYWTGLNSSEKAR